MDGGEAGATAGIEAIGPVAVGTGVIVQGDGLQQHRTWPDNVMSSINISPFQGAVDHEVQYQPDRLVLPSCSAS